MSTINTQMFLTPPPTQASSPKIPQRPVKNPKNLTVDIYLANLTYPNNYLTPPKEIICHNSVNNEKPALKKVKQIDEDEHELKSITKNLRRI